VSESTRLNRFLAQAGVASRRGADTLIAERRVAIDGVIVETAGARVDPGQVVTVDGREVTAERHVYLMLNKPSGYVTTAADEQGRQTVLDLVKVPQRVFPVGRLDLTTTGLLLLTNDGDLAMRLTHPRYGVEKTYRALVKGNVTPTELERLEFGVELDDGPTAPAKARIVGGDKGGSVLEITIHEGRNRQVRRMCEAIDHPVRSLRRTAFGPLRLGVMREGATRPLDANELEALQKTAGLRRR
jgi:pseudouridine synthase